MQRPLAGAIGGNTDAPQDGQRGDIGDHHDQAGLRNVIAHGLDHLRHPEAQGIDAKDDGEVGNHQRPDPPVLYHFAEAMHLGPVFARQPGHHHIFLALGQEVRLARIVRQAPERDNPQRQGGNAFQQVHPLPALEAIALNAQQPARKRRAQDV
jgi:hypothetical protein